MVELRGYESLTAQSLDTSGKSRPQRARSRFLQPPRGVRPRGPEDCTQPSRLHL